MIMPSSIKEFRGLYHFLSNFHEASVYWDGITYRNNEAAFQSAKLVDKNERLQFADMSPNEAKKLGRVVTLRKDWEDVKLNIMYEIVKAKFTQNAGLTIRLLETGDVLLEEGNHWGDRYWGTVNGIGENHLGKILMRVREELRGGVR